MQKMVGRTAGAHIILGMNLEEIDPTETMENIIGMLGFQP
jgi:hypothetical protein